MSEESKDPMIEKHLKRIKEINSELNKKYPVMENTQPVKESGNEAIEDDKFEFAGFCSTHYWTYDPVKKLWKNMFSGSKVTPPQLYNLFKQSKP